jgi:hypothetical protein
MFIMVVFVYDNANKILICKELKHPIYRVNQYIQQNTMTWCAFTRNEHTKEQCVKLENVYLSFQRIEKKNAIRKSLIGLNNPIVNIIGPQ